MGGLLRNAFGLFRLVKDSKGEKSWAHTLAVPSCILTMLRWLVGGLDLTLPTGVHIVIPVTAASDAAMLLGVWLVFLGQREYTEKKYGPGCAPVPQGLTQGPAAGSVKGPA